MNDPKRLIVLAWFVGLALIAAREVRSSRTLPNPAAMVKASILYSILMVVGEFAAPFAAALAIGYALVLLMQPGILPAAPTPTVTNAGGTTPRAQGGQTALGSQ